MILERSNAHAVRSHPRRNPNMTRRSTILALAINKWKGSSGSPASNDNAPCSHGSLESHAVHLVAIGILVIDNPASAYLCLLARMSGPYKWCGKMSRGDRRLLALELLALLTPNLHGCNDCPL